MPKDFRNELEEGFARRRITFLGAGPMSSTCVTSVIALANKYRKPISLIPSRRQVEAESLGGGYVNKWTTESFSKFVRAKDVGRYIKLSRDHSGPWQHSEFDAHGNRLSYEKAMAEAKESLEVDIECGFDLIHLDPSKGLAFGRTQSQVEDDIYDLMEFCMSKRINEFEFEIGADEQSSIPDLVSHAEENLIRVLEQIDKLSLPKPLFYVLQTGTKVMETRNIGSFDSKLPVEGMLSASVQVPEMLKMCLRHGIFLKEHNADYISTAALRWHRRFGIHAANVAPEFGVVETRALLQIAHEYKIETFIQEFSNTVIQGANYSKWLLPNSTCTDSDKVAIAGHYHFADENIISERLKMAETLTLKKINLEEIVQKKVEQAIDRYLREFGYAQ